MDEFSPNRTKRATQPQAITCAGCRKLIEELEDAQHDALAVREEAAERDRTSHQLTLALHEKLRQRHSEIAELRALLVAAA